MKAWWTDYPWRMIQTNLRQIDMEDIDADVYVRSLTEMGATVAMINVAGIIASYPTSLPFHTQSRFLQGDGLKQIIASCHEAGLRVIARTDFSKVRRALYEEHPQWACVYPGDVIEDYNGDVHCCINGDYQQVYAPKIIEEAISTLAVDGIFFNMGGYSTHNYSHEYLGMCRCDNCRRRFGEMFGLPLPETERMEDPTYRKYEVFKRVTVEEYRKRMVALIHSVRPEIAIDHNIVEGFGFLRQESNTEIGRALPHWQYSASDNTKWVRGSWPDLVCSNTTVDFIGFPYRHVAVSPAQQELRLWQNLANGGALDYYLIGRLDNHRDRSGFDAVRRVFAFHRDHWEDTYSRMSPDSDLLLVKGAGDTGEYRGWFRVLSEGHYLFDVCTVDRLSASDLSAYSGVILPDGKHLSGDAAVALDRYVADGGTLVATGESGFYNDQYEMQDHCALSCLGLTRLTAIRRDMTSALFEVCDKDEFPAMAERDLLYFGDTFIFAEYDSSVSGYLRLIPPHNFGPPERCYWTTETNIPGLLKRKAGRGQAVYLPWLPGALFHREGHDNTSVFLGDVLTSIAGLRPVGGNLSPMVEVSLASDRKRVENEAPSLLLLQLVNGSGHFGTTFYPPVQMRDVGVSIALSSAPKAATRLSDGAPVPFTTDGREVTFELDRLGFYEGIRVSL